MKTNTQSFIRINSATTVQSIKVMPSPATCHSPPASSSILLIAINARFSHSSYSVRTLKANLHELEDECEFLETELCITPVQLVAQITERDPKIVGFSIYLWNVHLFEAAARILKKIAPQIKLVAGGPELTIDYPNTDLFDLCILGEGETTLRESCRSWLNNPAAKLPSVIEASPENTDALKLPFHLYSDEDIANRVIYVEASRGCPYNCTYCTSAGTGLRLIPLKTLLPGLDNLWQRGVRRFKFLDRSFTASRSHAYAIMQFFKDKITPETCLHFEVNTDRLTRSTMEMIADFPEGALHLECGIQTLNPDVAERVGRNPDVDTTLSNLKFLTEETGADIHADLIFGLPGEDETSFATGFNKLIKSCNPPAVQINLLKALPGTELSKKAGCYNLKFNQEPPYELLESGEMDFSTLTHIQRLARCWELVHNRSKFEKEIKKLFALSPDVYKTFMGLAEHIYREEGRMHKIAQSRLKKLIDEFQVLTE